MKKLLLILILLLVFSTGKTLASLGVGVGVGKIQVDQKLKPGQIYNLPPITVLNTGDTPSDYTLVIEHQEKQPQIIPQSDWFGFSPSTFHLESKKVKEVKITLNLPINAKPGDYFAYLEAHPVKKTKAGTTSVNIAAATKLYFTVVPASLLAAIYYKLLSLWNILSPWPQIILGGVIIFLSGVLVKRFFNIEIKLEKKGIPRWAIVLVAAIFLIIYVFFWIKFFNLI